MSSLSSNDNNDSMARATYYAQQQLLAQQHQQQMQYQQAQLHMQYQQQKALLNKNQQHQQHNPISNTNNTHPTYNINNTYSAASCVNNYSQIANNNNLPAQHINAHNNIPATLAHHPNNSHQQYQHPSLSTVFPSIYAETNFNKSNNGNNSLNMSSSSAPNQYSSVQRQIQQDWSNREYIEVIVSNIKKLTDFLNTFELSCRSKMAILDEKLTKLERQIDFVEAKVSKGESLN